MKLDISWKTAIKLGFFFQMGVVTYKSIDRVAVDAMDSAMMSLAEKGYEPAMMYCKKYHLKTETLSASDNPRRSVIGFNCYSEES